MGEFGERILEGWGRKVGLRGPKRRTLTLDIFSKVMKVLPKICASSRELMLFSALVAWMFFGAFKVSELLGGRGCRGIIWEEVSQQQEGLEIWLYMSKTDQRSEGRSIFLRD